jgi:ankyrin repeat protein
MALYERPLITAIKNDDASLVENLIKNGANVNSRDSNEVLALVLAASLGKTEIVKVLLASGEEVRNSASEALLHLCTFKTPILEDKKICKNIKSIVGISPTIV